MFNSFTPAAGRLALGLGIGIAAFAPAAFAGGWQNVGIFSVPTGLVSLQEGYNCPQNLQVAHAGAYAMNSVGQQSQVYVSFNGPRIDETPPAFNNWAWHFYWPAGAPAGITIQFSAYCAKN